MNLIGLAGLLAIAAAWIPPTFKTLQRRKSDLPKSFLLLTVLGNLCLTIYSLHVGDSIFSLLNGFALVQASINLYFRLLPMKPA